MVDNPVIAIQSTGLFFQAVFEWNGLLLENKTWSELKYHFCEAYKVYLATGAGTSAHRRYAKKVMEAKNNYILGTIRDGFSVLIMANNSRVQRNNNSMAWLREEIAATQQQLSIIVISRAAPSVWGSSIPPTVATPYTPPPPLPLK